VLRAIARRHPELSIPILTGVSAGAINTAYLAARPAGFGPAADALVKIWLDLSPEQVFRVDAASLLHNVVRWMWRLVAGGAGHPERLRGMVDTTPLRGLLERVFQKASDRHITGIARNIERGTLRSVALSATSYTTSQSVTWIEGREVSLWQRPQRVAECTRLTVDHVMASAALPLLFPAICVGNAWYGDGGVRQVAPLSPALHLGATRILTISTRYRRSLAEAEESQIKGYPPPAQVLGVLYNAIFLDLIDQDIARLELVNRLVRSLPPERREGMREVEMLVLRPSRDLGRLARDYEPRLPGLFRFLTRGLGTRRTASPDILSLVMFQRDYVQALVELGEHDAEEARDRIDEILGR
jgi:NTE family protein